jgi:amidase
MLARKRHPSGTVFRRSPTSQRPLVIASTALATAVIATAVSATPSPAAAGLLSAQSRVAVIEASLSRIAANDSRWKATIVVRRGEALSEAAAADALRPVGALGPLDGLALTVKDNIEVAGVATSAGARALQVLGPVRSSATVVHRLGDTGAIVIATTNMDTYARGVRGVSEVRGQTANPVRPGRNAGGSSAGAAASVAAGYVDVALGTDTCGSIRYPAAAVGLFGLRPGSGLVSRAGVVPLSPTQDEVGILTSRPSLLEPVLRAISGPDPRDPSVSRELAAVDRSASTAGISRVGVIGRLGRWRKGADGTTVLDTLRRRGVELVNVTLPSIPNPSVINSEALPSRARYLNWRKSEGTSLDQADPWLDPQRPLAVSNPSRYRELLATRATVRAKLLDTMRRNGVDALILPASTADPALLGASQPSGNCFLAATSGLPALAIPGPPDASGVAVVGAEVLGPVDSEIALTQLAVIVASPR